MQTIWKGLILSLALLLSFLAEGEAAEIPVAPDWETQVKIIVNHRNVWELRHSNADRVRYAVTDLDENGALEIIVAELYDKTVDYNPPMDDYTIYEVDSINRSLRRVEKYIRYDMPSISLGELDILSQFQGYAGPWYAVSSQTRDESGTLFGVEHLSLVNGSMFQKGIAYHHVGMSNDGERYYDGYGRAISQEEYNNLIKMYDQYQYDVVLGWVEGNTVHSARTKKELSFVLGDTYQIHVGLKNAFG